MAAEFDAGACERQIRKRLCGAARNGVRVLSIDVGLRNLGLSLVRSKETTCDAAPESLRVFVESCCEVMHAENIDVLEENGCTAKNAKSIGPMKQIAFWHACMMRRYETLLRDPPHIIVVEIQDGGNATMRQVSTGIVGLLMGHFETRRRLGQIERVPEFDMVRGDMKLRVCDAILGPLDEPHTEQAADAPPADAPPAAANAPPPEYLKKINPRRYFAMLKKADQASGAAKPKIHGRSKASYEQRKKRAVEALAALVGRAHLGAINDEWAGYTKKKQRDVADAVLQGVWVLWVRIQQPVSRKRTRPATAAPET